MAIEMPACARHPNRAPFRGVLTLVGVASDRPPAGARGHRVLLTQAAAEAALPSLLGMALDYAPSLDRHDARRKIGIITSADVARASNRRDAARLEVAGYVFGRDFPDAVRELRAGGRARLGMSYEISDARVEDVRAAIWTLTDVTFTGAAVLRRDKAAYRETWIELQ
ncbi:MAG TPA: hypothetical protein VFG86_09105 [Chloroflexota bacterium]|nr:hypothetical protein [Chloroflexota bacterium]